MIALTITPFLLFLCGLFNGFMDAITQYDSLKHWGPRWAANAWKFYHDDKIDIWERVMQSSFDAWHVLKTSMLLLFVCAIILNATVPPDLSVWWNWPCYLVGLLVCFNIGFRFGHIKA